MSEKKPTFSVVLPTYNRAQYLPLAIRSVLNQTYSDFELIISNGGSTDNTKDVVRGFDDKRIIYLESDKKLGMAQNYELALEKAAGEYVVFFSDDDAFVDSMLEKVRKVILDNRAKMVVFPLAFYYPEKFKEFNLDIEENTLEFTHFTGNIERVASETAVERMYKGCFLKDGRVNTKYAYPLIGNLVCEHSVIKSVKEKVGKVFGTVPLDIYFITLLLNSIEDYYSIDEPLLVWSKWSQNSSLNAKKGRELRQHYENLLDGEELNYVPLKFAFPTNCYANALLKAERIIPKIRQSEIDWQLYFVEMHNYLQILEAEEVDVSRELTEYKQVLANYSVEFQRKVKKGISGKKFSVKDAIKNNLPATANLLRRILNRELPKKTLIKGIDAGFNNVLEAAQFLNGRVS